MLATVSPLDPRLGSRYCTLDTRSKPHDIRTEPCNPTSDQSIVRIASAGLSSAAGLNPSLPSDDRRPAASCNLPDKHYVTVLDASQLPLTSALRPLILIRILALFFCFIQE